VSICESRAHFRKSIEIGCFSLSRVSTHKAHPIIQVVNRDEENIGSGKRSEMKNEK